jgi:hypothetical protein
MSLIAGGSSPCRHGGDVIGGGRGWWPEHETVARVAAAIGDHADQGRRLEVAVLVAATIQRTGNLGGGRVAAGGGRRARRLLA